MWEENTSILPQKVITLTLFWLHVPELESLVVLPIVSRHCLKAPSLYRWFYLLPEVAFPLLQCHMFSPGKEGAFASVIQTVVKSNSLKLAFKISQPHTSGTSPSSKWSLIFQGLSNAYSFSFKKINLHKLTQAPKITSTGHDSHLMPQEFLFH